MTTTGLGPRGNPIIGNPPTRIADYAAISNYAAVVGNRVVGFSSDRLNFSAAYGYAPYDGLEYYETDTTYLYQFRGSFWKEIDLDLPFSTAGTVNANVGEGYVTVLRIGHRIGSVILNVDPGPNGLSASSTNNLIGNIPAGFRPATSLVKRAEWRGGSSWSGTDWARVRFDALGNVTVMYTTGPIPNGGLLSVEASWPIA